MPRINKWELQEHVAKDNGIVRDGKWALKLIQL